MQLALAADPNYHTRLLPHTGWQQWPNYYSTMKNNPMTAAEGQAVLDHTNQSTAEYKIEYFLLPLPDKLVVCVLYCILYKMEK